jgi:hypothetical protein
MKWQKSIRWLFLYPALAVAGCNTLLTGSPIPFWHIESLVNPVAVHSVSQTHFELEDGRKVALPFIKEIPSENPLLLAAISNGIEISPCGEAFGLMWLDRNCGNDLVVWRRLRTNLSLLSAALHPAGIDEARIHPDAIAYIQENKRIDLSIQSSSHRKHHLTVWDWSMMRAIQQEFEAATETSTPNHF